ncbi:hypothetical protein QR680_004039 [Steinernema hermaphroditum]|uniref:Galectin n=1 Tax=Steinernema hermaphroditum TaxID=289476 RepID=A0AA39HNI6_9BILA|nr:hypothetical protein QR680_004039 [Steinernema hermaphroditum]
MLLWSGPLLLLLCLPEITHAETAASSGRVKPASVQYRKTLDGMNHQIGVVRSLPVVIDFDEQLLNDQMIRIEGHLPMSFKSFNITLGYEHNTEGEYAPLQINFQKEDFYLRRVEKGEFVNSSFSKHYVHSKELDKRKLGVIPQVGKKFVIHIRMVKIPTDYFHIVVSHSTTALIKNIYTLNLIEQISFDGDATIEHVEWGGSLQRSPLTETFPPMREGRVVITGRCNNDKSFAVALVAPNLDQPFYFNVRFNEHKALANSYLKNEWGPEEDATKFPFDPFGRFDITLLVDTYEVKVLAHGELIMRYKHRISNPREDYHGIWVEGADVTDIIWT